MPYTHENRTALYPRLAETVFMTPWTRGKPLFAGTGPCYFSKHCSMVETETLGPNKLSSALQVLIKWKVVAT